MKKKIFLLYVVQLLITSSLSKEVLIFHDDFDTLDFKVWEHEITLSGGGNWEFEMYWNNRSNTFV